MPYAVKSIVRKKPTRFANIGWSGSKTIGRAGAAKKIKQMRALHQRLKAKGGGALGYKAQHHEVQRAIKAAKKRKVVFAVNS